MDFSLTPELQELQQRTRAFIRDRIIPLEGEQQTTTVPPRSSAGTGRWPP
jgi:hypothetical protein